MKSYSSSVKWVAKVVEACNIQSARANATGRTPLTTHYLTNPPMYGSPTRPTTMQFRMLILSDFFFVWLKRIVGRHPLMTDPFDPDLIPYHPKTFEDQFWTRPRRPMADRKDRQWFEETMAKAFGEGHRMLVKKALAQSSSLTRPPRGGRLCFQV